MPTVVLRDKVPLVPPPMAAGVVEEPAAVIDSGAAEAEGEVAGAPQSADAAVEVEAAAEASDLQHIPGPPGPMFSGCACLPMGNPSPVTNGFG